MLLKQQAVIRLGHSLPATDGESGPRLLFMPAAKLPPATVQPQSPPACVGPSAGGRRLLRFCFFRRYSSYQRSRSHGSTASRSSLLNTRFCAW